MRSRRRFVPQVDSLLSRIVLDAGATGVVLTCSEQPTDQVAIVDMGGPQALPPDDSDGTTVTPVMPC